MQIARLAYFYNHRNLMDSDIRRMQIARLAYFYNHRNLMDSDIRRMQIARLAFFTVPALAASVGWMAALEIGKKVMMLEV